MNVSKQEMPGSLVEITVEETPEFVSEALDKAYRRLVKRVDVPGWRRGKAPRHILERYVGRRALCEEAERYAVPELYEKAAQELGLDVVGEPEFKEITLEPGQPLRFRAVVPVRPKAQPGDYRSLAIPFPEVSVSRDEVEEGVKRARESVAHLDILPEDQPLKEGDYARVHVKGLEGGEVSVELDRDFDLVEVGSREHPLIPGLARALVGMKKGESREFTGRYLVRAKKPEEQSQIQPAGGAIEDGTKSAASKSEGRARGTGAENPERSGEGVTAEPETRTVEARFQVVVLEAYSKHMPTDEEFLRHMGKPSMEEVEKDVESFIKSQKLERAWRSHTEKVEDALLEKGSVELPDVMIENRTRTLLDDFLRDLEKMGVKPEDYLRRTGLTWETIVSDLKERAERQLKLELILDAIAENEGIQADEEQVNAVVSGIAKDTGRDEVTVKTTLEMRGVMDEVRRELTRSKTLRKIALEAAERAGKPVPEAIVKPQADEDKGSGEVGGSQGSSETVRAEEQGSSRAAGEQIGQESGQGGRSAGTEDRAEPGQMALNNKE
ncbi:MAG: trigger factor [Firmicutes bacterium]|nr:trigger factor [Candidatus Fermentithermobacillaceae bacterium]